MIATNVCFLGDLRSHDTQTRCEVQDEEDPEAEEEEDDEESTAPLPGSSAEIRVDGALRNLPLAVAVLVRHKEENKKLQENEMFQKKKKMLPASKEGREAGLKIKITR